MSHTQTSPTKRSDEQRPEALYLFRQNLMQYKFCSSWVTDAPKKAAEQGVIPMRWIKGIRCEKKIGKKSDDNKI